MTSIGLTEADSGIVTVEEGYDYEGRQVLTVNSPKSLGTWVIRKDRSPYAFFEIVLTTGGPLAEALQGRFSSVEKAFEILYNYLRTRPVSGQTQAKLRYRKAKDSGTADRTEGN